jgi:hypothetical protein
MAFDVSYSHTKGAVRFGGKLKWHLALTLLFMFGIDESKLT